MSDVVNLAIAEGSANYDKLTPASKWIILNKGLYCSPIHKETKKMIRFAKAEDASKIANIYNYYVTQSAVTFEEELVSADEMSERIQQVISQGLPWLVAENDQKIQGYAYANQWKGRFAYRYTVEITVYLSHLATSQGLGSQLYDQLFKQLKQTSVHAAIGGIALPNKASIALHEKFGMKKVAHFEEVGFKFNQWVDVGYWQINLEQE